MFTKLWCGYGGRIIIFAGAAANTVSIEGKIPLMLAVRNRSFDVVQVRSRI